MKRSLMLIAAMCIAFACGTSGVMADDVEWTTTFTSLTAQNVEHADVAPFKGSAKVIVENDTDEYWTDFHFQVFSVNNSNITATIFVDGAGYDPTSSQGGLTWTIDNSPTGATMNLYFTDTVAPGETAWFKVYTDNTTYKERFGLSIYPTTVPEPGSLLALAGGMFGFVGLALRRRK